MFKNYASDGTQGDELGEPAAKRAGGPRWKPLRYSMFRCGDGKGETFGVPNAFCE